MSNYNLTVTFVSKRRKAKDIAESISDAAIDAGEEAGAIEVEVSEYVEVEEESE